MITTDNLKHYIVVRNEDLLALANAVLGVTERAVRPTDKYELLGAPFQQYDGIFRKRYWCQVVVFYE